MNEYKLSKKISIFKFEIFLDINFDNLGNIESYEFYDGLFYYDNPSDICFSKVFCDERKENEWNLFLNDLLYLFDNEVLFKKIKKLKIKEDSYYFDEEEIKITLIGID